MADKVSFECPGCFTKLSTDSSKLGKKIKCPKCDEVFKPEPLDDSFDDDDEFDKPASSKRSQGSSKGSKKPVKGKPAAQSGSSAPLIIGGVVAVLALAGVGLYLSGVFSPKPAAAPPPIAHMPMSMPVAPGASHAPVFPPAAASAVAAPAPAAISEAEKVLGLRWMPPDTGLIVHVKVSSIWEAPLLKKLLSDPKLMAGIKEMEDKVGLTPSDLESVTYGMPDAVTTALNAKLEMENRATGNSQLAPGMLGGDFFEKQHSVLIIKSKKRVDLARIAQLIPAAMGVKTIGDTEIEVRGTVVEPAFSVWTKDGTTIILSSTYDIQKIKERGETTVPRKELLSIDPSAQLVVAGVVRGPTKDEIQKYESKQLEFPPAVQSGRQMADKGIQLLGLGLSIKGGFGLKVYGAGTSADAMAKLKTEAEQQLGTLKAEFEKVKQTAPPLFAELGETLLNNLKIEDKNQVLSGSTSIPDSDQSKLEQVPTIVMMMAMTGGLANLGGPPQGGPPGAGFGSPGIGGGGGFGGPSPFGPPGLGGAGFNMPPGGPLGPLPGETQPVGAASVDGLPDGLTMTAHAAWHPMMDPGADGSKRQMEILIEITGDGLSSICAATGVSPKTMTVEGGKLKKAKRAGGPDPAKAFSLFDVNELIAVDHPPQVLRVKAIVDAPSSPAAKIDVLEGSFKLLSSTGTQELTIDDVPKIIKRPLMDPELKSRDIRLKRGHGGGPESIGVICGKEQCFLGRVHGTPGDVVSMTEFEGDKPVQRLYPNDPSGRFPDDFQIKFVVHENVEEKTVNFRFENVLLPSPESAP